MRSRTSGSDGVFGCSLSSVSDIAFNVTARGDLAANVYSDVVVNARVD